MSHNPSSIMSQAHSSSTSLSWFSWASDTARSSMSLGFSRKAIDLFVITLAGILLFLKLTNRAKKPKVKKGSYQIKFQRSLSLASLRGGNVALLRMVDAQRARVDPCQLASAEHRFRELIAEDPPKIAELQREASILEISGHEEEAIDMLQAAIRKAEERHQPHEAHELEMLLVEMLIYQGKFDDALKCKCLGDKEITDARRPLYMAVIDIILGKYDSAKELWEEFKEIRRHVRGPSEFFASEEMNDIAFDFEKLKEIVDALNEEIKLAWNEKDTK
ncbi:hypothetical protein AMTRI_Chr03g47860 [Amborella trichopoda]|uniref:uncharacterized protein LOC18430546 n=1 Tax=Amborella trichopoda TaxID=13333 RepID=UPI0009C0DC67|nr:uncharacterized protein LOC18430546 [Amborella trichopoda]|eukprot:XP_006840760.3 uncharacterized protein LOC18430546 [Amborella trichopoda]